MTNFCTISTQSHLHKTFALADSLAKFNFKLVVLIVDTDVNSLQQHENVQFLHLNELKGERNSLLVRKYRKNKDKLRWALKSALLLHLLHTKEKMIYIDNDIYFFQSPQYLLDQLSTSSVLLTPHFYPSSPKSNQTWLEANFRIGLYNAGFIAVNKDAKEALKWWRECCIYEVKKAYWRGLFDDQKYLDLFPVLFDRVQIIKDRGCNLAGWNDYANLDKEEVTFVHFNGFTLNKFSDSKNGYHYLFKQYEDQLKRYSSLVLTKRKRLTALSFQNAFYYIRWKLSRLK